MNEKSFDERAYEDAVRLAESCFHGGSVGITALANYINAIYDALAAIRAGERQ